MFLIQILLLMSFTFHNDPMYVNITASTETVSSQKSQPPKAEKPKNPKKDPVQRPEETTWSDLKSRYRNR